MKVRPVAVTRLQLVLGGIAVLILGGVIGAAIGGRVGTAAAPRTTTQRPFIFGTIHAEEMQALAARYGPGRNSDQAEEWIVRDYFQDKRGGVFLDVGANHYRQFSNTYFLETALGWSGLAIEPQTKFAADYIAHRPRTRFIPVFVSDVPNTSTDLFVPAGDDQWARASKDLGVHSKDRISQLKVPVTTLDDVLARAGITRIDYLTMDIELAEPKALAGFSVERFRPALCSVEAYPPVRQAVLDYFAQHHYRIVGKYLRADERNVWFEPMPGT